MSTDIYFDLPLINNIQEKNNLSNESLSQLIERHSGIYLEIVNNYIPNDCPYLNKKDLIEDKNYYIYQAALKYKEDKGAKFSTYLGNETKWMCLNLVNKHRKYPVFATEQEDIERNSPQVYNFNNAMRSELFHKVISLAEGHPDSRVGKIFTMRYVVGKKNKVMPWQQISEDLEMSIQGCINIHNEALEIFKKKLLKE